MAEAMVDNVEEGGLQGEDISHMVPDFEALASVHDDDPDAELNVEDLDGNYLGERHNANTQESEQSQDQQEGEEKADDPTFTLDDGTEVALSDLRSGYMMQRDYTQKTERLAADRRETESLQETYRNAVGQVQAQNQALLQFVQTLIPDEPDIGLAQSDPANYQYQSALRQRAIQEVQSVLGSSQQTNQYAQQVQAQHIDKLRETEEFKLTNSVPRLRDPAKRAEYMKVVQDTGKEFGFSADEINGVFDHRLLQLVYYANLGKVAERNRKNVQGKAKQTTATNRSGRRGKSVVSPKANQAALQRLGQTGSLDDAMNVDFDF